MLLMAEVVRISDRFADRSNPDSLDRQERLRSCLVLVTIFYVIMCIGLVKLSTMERPRVIHHIDPDVAFELTVAPPEPRYQLRLPPAPALTPGAEVSGGKPSEKPNDTTNNLPLINAKPIQEPVKPHLAAQRSVPEEAPISVVSTNNIRRFLSSEPAPVSQIDATSDGVTASKTTGRVRTTGASDDTHGKGAGGQGVGLRTGAGDGEHDDNIGGKEITRSLPEISHVAKGNIKPYTKALLVNLVQQWRPTQKDQRIVITLVIDKTGQLIDASILESGGKNTDRRVLRAAQNCTFAPLPDWFKGEELTFNLTLDPAELLSDR